MELTSVGTPSLWIGFLVFVLFMLALDLGVFHRKAHVVSIREALTWTGVWVGVALLFSVGLYFWFGAELALEFLAGYVIEKALSVDNIFVFIVVFGTFSVPSQLQHRVLFWGILGALVMRAGFILAGAALLSRFHWVMYVFGAFLVWSGLRLFKHDSDDSHPEQNPLFRLFRRFIPSVGDYRGTHFVVKEGGKRYATPLLLVLVAIETTDIVFAVDSIPAIFAVTTDPFIVYTSNVFAILGLRALYFALAGMMGRFHYLNLGLAGVLLFVGIKMLVSGVYKIPIVVSLLVIVLLLTVSVVASLLRPKPDEPSAGDPPARDASPDGSAHEASLPQEPPPAIEPPAPQLEPAEQAGESPEFGRPPGVKRQAEPMNPAAGRHPLTIVCGVDSSNHAAEASRVAAAWAHRLGTTLKLVHVADAVPWFGAGPSDATRVDALSARLEAAATTLRDEFGATVETRVITGAPDEGLVDLAGRAAARLIVLGSLGAREQARWLLGSVAERVAQSSKTPVLIVRASAPLVAWAQGRARLRVMVGVEQTAPSLAALHWVAELAALGQCEVHVVRVVWPVDEHQRIVGTAPLPLDQLVPEVEETLLGELRAWAGPIAERSDVSLAVHGGWGKVDAHLTQLATSWDADLLVVGTHQRARMARLWQGSVSRGVLHGASMNVATVP